MPVLRLYGFPVSPNVRVARLAFHEKAVPVEFVEIAPDHLATEGYAAINPFRRMPALVAGDLTLFETPALMTYADGVGSGPGLEPTDPVERARMWQFVGIAQHDLYRSGAMGLYVHAVLARVFGLPPDPAAAEAAVAPTARALDVLERGLAGGALAGGALSHADLYCGAMTDYVGRTRAGRTLIDERPGVSAWLGALRARPSFGATFAPMLEGTDEA